MKVLWVISQLLPIAANKLDLKASNFGGWVKSMLEKLSRVQEIELGVVMCSEKIKESIQFSEDGTKYYILPVIGKNKCVSKQGVKITLKDFSPDIIHIEGTEWSISDQFSQMKEYPVLVSLQGILNGYEQYQAGGLPLSEFMLSLSWTKLITGWTLFFRKRLLFDKRLEIERQTISNAQYLMGRTLWDRAHSYVFNKSAKYFTCNRTLRESFYSNEWDYGRCSKHRIFVGNGYSALKGGHTVLEAVCLLVDEFPDLKVAFAGEDPFIHGKKDVKKRIGYSFYIRQMLKRTELQDRVEYLGERNEKEMVECLLKSNVYVLPSLIENSPNTLGEAMIMGVPCISAYTGGASEMAIDEKEALIYRAGDPVMLAYQIKRIFDMKDTAASMCEAAQRHARITHDPQKNLEALLNAYNEILKEKTREV